jgi:hypothetical protein
MNMKLKAIDRLLLIYIAIIYLMVLCGCKTKHVTEQRIDSVVKEVYSIKDSVRNETIFEYETIYDTIRKEYITNIKRIIATESQNKTLQGTKDVKVSKDTKEVVKEPIKSLNRFWWVLLIFGGIIGFLIRK